MDRTNDKMSMLCDKLKTTFGPDVVSNLSPHGIHVFVRPPISPGVFDSESVRIRLLPEGWALSCSTGKQEHLRAVPLRIDGDGVTFDEVTFSKILHGIEELLQVLHEFRNVNDVGSVASVGELEAVGNGNFKGTIKFEKLSHSDWTMLNTLVKRLEYSNT